MKYQPKINYNIFNCNRIQEAPSYKPMQPFTGQYHAIDYQNMNPNLGGSDYSLLS